MLAVKSRCVCGLKWAALHFIKALCLSPGDIWVSVSVINVKCCVCIRWILLCMCSSSRRRIYQKQRFISTLLSPCLFAYKYPCGRPERSWVRSAQPQKNTENKGQNCSGFGFELGFCSWLYTLPFSGTTARNGGLFSGGSGSPKHPSARDGHQLLSVFEAVKGAGGIHPWTQTSLSAPRVTDVMWHDQKTPIIANKAIYKKK